MERLLNRCGAPEEELAFRLPLAVEELVLYRSGEAYPLCPKCGVPLDREYQHFCDRCGQRLDWSRYGRALITARF